MKSSLRFAAFMIAAAVPVVAEAADMDVTVHVTGIDKPKGEVFAALYEDSSWSGDHALSTAHVAVNGSDVTLHLTAPRPGKYAIKMFHNLDGSGKLATNFLGIPTEPYAFSNNATGTMGPPTFAAAAFSVGADGAIQEIQMR